MKILHILSTSKWTGPATYIVDILNYLNKNCVENLVAIRTKPDGNLKEILKLESIRYYNGLILYKKFNPFYFFNDFFKLKNLINNFNPDIVHVHFSLENILSILIKNKKFKLIRSIHNTKSTKKRAFSKFILNKNDYIHTICNDYRDNLIKFNKIPAGKIKVISGWVDTEKFTPSGDKLIEDDFIKIGMVARFQERRGHKYLVKAFKNIEQIGNIKLILTGRGEYKEKIENLAQELNLGDKIIFTGYIKDKLPELLRSLDIFVLLEEGTDGTCRAILEAMASGLPIVSVKKGAIQDTVIEGVNGFLIDSKKNIKELSEKIKILIEDEKLRRKFSKNSRNIAIEKFSKSKKLKEFLNFYKEILKST